MGSVVDAKRRYFKQATGSTDSALADLEEEYYTQAAEGTALVVPEATTTQEGTVKQAVFIAQVAVPFADLTAAATAHNALLTALKNAGVMKPTA
jgi:hypothetical protein